jgi:phosphoglucomutase
MGKDTHALSEPALRTALEVLVANGVETIMQRDQGVTPTPVISHVILVYNRSRAQHRADRIVVTPSHNPPEDGGFKYNPPHGGPADTDVTKWIEERANALLRDGNAGVRRVPYAKAVTSAATHQEDLVLPYVRDLENVVDMGAIRDARLALGADGLGGAARPYWELWHRGSWAGQRPSLGDYVTSTEPADLATAARRPSAGRPDREGAGRRRTSCAGGRAIARRPGAA